MRAPPSTFRRKSHAFPHRQLTCSRARGSSPFHPKFSEALGGMYSKEPDSYSCLDAKNVLEPDPDDSEGGESSNSKLYLGTHGIFQGPCTYGKAERIECTSNGVVLKNGTVAEPDSDDMLASEMVKDATNYEPDPDDYYAQAKYLEYEKTFEPDPDDSQGNNVICAEPDPDDSQENYSTHAEPDPDDKLEIPCFASSFETLPALEMLTSCVVCASKPGSVLSTVKASSHDALAVGGHRVRPMEAATLLGTVVKIIELPTLELSDTCKEWIPQAKPRNIAKCSALLIAISAAALGEDSGIRM